jgi:hypothetical protein
MSNVQIYTWIGVPALTVLAGIKILLDALHHRALMARFGRFDAWIDEADLQLEKPPDKTIKLDIR